MTYARKPNFGSRLHCAQCNAVKREDHVRHTLPTPRIDERPIPFCSERCRTKYLLRVQGKETP